jgi:hypothetical protein
MFTRIVELTTKPGKDKQLSDTINDKILPILKKQKGFVDETVLISERMTIESSGSASGIPRRMRSGRRQSGLRH